MATVYLAQDVKHHRKVAVKVLRPELAATLGPDRFFREIEVAAQLQHPHILSLFDSGEAGGFLYYVMPYVEGESLRDRLAHHGELPIHDAVKILTEVADALALEAAANGGAPRCSSGLTPRRSRCSVARSWRATACSTLRLARSRATSTSWTW